MTNLKFFQLVATPIGHRPPTLRELREHLEKKGFMPARLDGTHGQIHMAIWLGGDHAVADGMVTLGWDTLALTTGWSYPVMVEEDVAHMH